MGEYEKYQVTEYDIRQSIMLIALKVFDIAGRTVAGAGERPFPEAGFPDNEVFYRPEKEFKKLISKELLGWIALHLAAQVGSEALVHSEKYERLDNEPIYQIWTPEYIKKHSEFAFYGLGGNETACVKSYLIKIEALKWINRIIGEQAGKPAAGRELIGWRGTPEQLEQLADELQKEKFVASAEAFAGQFKDKEDTAGEPCQWLKTDRSLIHLLEKLLAREVKAIPGETNIVNAALKHFRRKDGKEYSDSLNQNRSNAKDSTNNRGFDTLDTIISEVFM